VLGLGVGLAAAALLVDDDLAIVACAVSLAVLTAFAGLNRSVTGLVVAGLGLVANLAAVVLNNGMPVRADALLEADVVEPSELADYDPGDPRHVETDADAFDWLGAIVPVPVARQVVSFGDLLVLVGLTDAVRDVSRRRARGYGAATTQASVDQHWGTAPSDAPESGSQYSAKSETTAAEANEFWSDASVAPSPAHLAARHDK
jgi:hypothetical protein